MFGRSAERRTPPPIIFELFFFVPIWALLHNLIKQNNNFSILWKKINKNIGLLY